MRTSFASNESFLCDDPQQVIGRRSAPRLRLSIPARLVSLYANHRCILVDLSRTGAQIGLESPLRNGEGAFLQLAGIDQFGTIVRCSKGPNGGTNGLEFEFPLKDEAVVALRQYAETFRDEEYRALRTEVQEWVSGIH